MKSNDGVIVITGAAGFIASCMAKYLNEQGYNNLIISDDFSSSEKENNWKNIKVQAIVHRNDLLLWLNDKNIEVSAFLHLGARTDTTEFNYAIHEELNVQYSIAVWQYCVASNIPLIYASSAATYGSGELGYDDNHEVIEKLEPLNPYGISKNEFDKWVLKQSSFPPFWAGLKFFNVYGPNEYHKARMASVIFHSFNQIKDAGVVKLFRSHKEGYKDGQQLRDFVYVKDLVKVMYWLMSNTPESGIYNLGTGKARSFFDLVAATFNAINEPLNVQYIDMPIDIRDKYQYFTEANMQKLRNAGYTNDFYTLEEGITDYVQNYLAESYRIW